MNRDNVITYVVHLNLKTSHRPPAFQEINAIITKNIMLVMLPRFHAPVSLTNVERAVVPQGEKVQGRWKM